MLSGRVYGLDDSNIVYVLDAATGKDIGKRVRLRGTITRASPVYADGKIFACTTTAWHVLTPTAYWGKDRPGDPLPERRRDLWFAGCFARPDISADHVEHVLHWRGRWQNGGRPSAGNPVAESAITDKTPAQVQVVPAEYLATPGEKVQYKTRLFNAMGQLLKETEATYTVEGPAQIDSRGLFEAGTLPQGPLGGNRYRREVARIGRHRTAPRVPDRDRRLPWKFDFNDDQVPVTWVGARYRHVPRDLDGEHVIAKITTIPKGTRSQAWMGPTNLHDYTIQADVRGSMVFIDVPLAGQLADADKEKDEAGSAATADAPAEKPAGDGKTEKVGKMPDIGLIAQRYTLDLMGASQQVQIRSWTAVLDRFSKSVAFPWKPDTWYTMKFQANVVDGKAVLKGKVWLRGEPEPEAWTIEATDDAPNTEGSPGLFGNASNAELFYDNILVTPSLQRSRGSRSTVSPRELSPIADITTREIQRPLEIDTHRGHLAGRTRTSGLCGLEFWGLPQP